MKSKKQKYPKKIKSLAQLDKLEGLPFSEKRIPKKLRDGNER